MKGHLLLTLAASFTASLFLFVGCSEPERSGFTSTTTPLAGETEEWALLNRYLNDLYGLPPVETTKELQLAAFLISEQWFALVDDAIKALEREGIAWERTRPFCYLSRWYIESDIALRNASTPIELLATDNLLVDRVRDFDTVVDDILIEKRAGVPQNLAVYESEAECVEGFAVTVEPSFTPMPNPTSVHSPGFLSTGPTFDPDSGSCLNTPAVTIEREWQVSAPRGVPGPARPGEIVQLGLRNKFGEPGEQYWLLVRVIAPNGASTTNTRYLRGSAWTYVLYPTDFTGALTAYPGIYAVVWESEGGFIACDGFIVESY